MRRVILVPLVHDEADLGSAGPALLVPVRLIGTGVPVQDCESV